MIYWIPVPVFPQEQDVKKDISYGYNSEFTGTLNIDPSNIVQLSGISIDRSIENELLQYPPMIVGEIDRVPENQSLQYPPPLTGASK